MLVLLLLLLGVLVVVELPEAHACEPARAAEPPRLGRDLPALPPHLLLFDQREPGVAAHGAGLGQSP
jgi:hypothetical protein